MAVDSSKGDMAGATMAAAAGDKDPQRGEDSWRREERCRAAEVEKVEERGEASL